MVGRLAPGLLLAAAAAAAIALSDVLGMELQHIALLGVALGGTLALVPHQFEWGRIGGFLAGFAIGWLGFAARAALLPDSGTGRAVAALVVGVLVTGVAVASRGRLPLWSGLLGAAAIVAAYEETYTSAPAQFVAESPQAATTVLLAVAIGYLAASASTLITAGERPVPSDPEGLRRRGPFGRGTAERFGHPMEQGVEALEVGETK